MLPNFRRTEPDLGKNQTGNIVNEVAAVSARPVLSVGTRVRDRTVSVVGPDLTITGNLVSQGEVQVDGTVNGDIHGSHVVIGATAVINGGIIAEEIVVRGHVVGSVRSKRVMLQSTSQVEGDIYHQSLSIEQGALFEGKSRRTSSDPRTIPLHGATHTATHAVTPALEFPPIIPELTH